MSLDIKFFSILIAVCMYSAKHDMDQIPTWMSIIY